MRATAIATVVVLATSAGAHEPRYHATLRSAYDGDTIRADIDMPIGGIVLVDQPIRLMGFDAPEIRGSCDDEKARARRARDRLVEIIEGGDLTLAIDPDNQRGKYGRWLADAYVDGRHVGEMMIAEGLARPYAGGTRRGWCAGRE